MKYPCALRYTGGTSHLPPGDIHDLQVIDHYLIRSLFHAHSKVPVEHLFLETSALPIPYVISARRLIYLQTILKRSERELTRRVYEAQKQKTGKGDWIQLIRDDMDMIKCNLRDDEVRDMPTNTYKLYIKQKVREAAFEQLNNTKESHTKVKHNKYDNLFQPQDYIKSHIFNDQEKSLLFAMRSRTVRGLKDNFPYLQYGGDTTCPLCQDHRDSQEGVLSCKKLKNLVPVPASVTYGHIYGNMDEQKGLVEVFARLLGVRDQLLSDREDVQHCLPGQQYWARAPCGGQ